MDKTDLHDGSQFLQMMDQFNNDQQQSDSDQLLDHNYDNSSNNTNSRNNTKGKKRNRTNSKKKKTKRKTNNKNNNDSDNDSDTDTDSDQSYSKCFGLIHRDYIEDVHSWDVDNYESDSCHL